MKFKNDNEAILIADNVVMNGETFRIVFFKEIFFLQQYKNNHGVENVLNNRNEIARMTNNDFKAKEFATFAVGFKNNCK